ncbi:putative phosphate transporter, phosphate binding protein [Crocosphaera subtropica ATCC 51142]|uniref:Phosphate transporter, phosphate binding protein n=1 Tax=Crocosphaera subtropica (strain ATCC 51142 / BH68) TaxID=43989 RepID=B1WUN8_CROS5|nr:phosphate ABC transporter substrate-binding protein [Crocosphaera subtropica]ACB50489.1 putative phosphate transporter, phosphate binding protein [Crocosphaera subtropica ATCC 51142]
MNPKKDTLITVLSLVLTLAILGVGYGLFARQSKDNPNNFMSSPTSKNQPLSSNTTLPSPPSPSSVTAFSPPTTVPQGTTVKIDGSTSLVFVNQALKNRFEQQFPGVQVQTNAQGSSNGIDGLLENRINIAAISRPLTADEQAKGLVAIPISKDAIAVVVGVDNNFRKSLTSTQVKDIFQGKIQNWSEVGGSSEEIRVINRPSVSGTREIFAELALNSENFGNTSNITTMDRDATTPILQQLGSNGISYATYTQVADQQTVRTVPIDGLTPEATNYPYTRTLYYAYKNPPSEAVKAFLGYATSPTGQQIIQDAQ